MAMTKKEQLELKQLELDVALKEEELRKAKLEASHEAAHLQQTELDLAREARDQKYWERDNNIRDLRYKTRTVRVSGIVDDRMAEYFRGDFKTWELVNQVDELEVDEVPVTVLINSPGGYVIPGLDMFDLIMEYRNKGWKINTKVTGMAMSMAGVLLQAGEERTMTPRSTFMLHEVATYAEGKVSDLKDQIQLTESLQLHCSKILADRSHLSVDEVNDLWERRDVFLTADKALEYGFIDGITE